MVAPYTAMHLSDATQTAETEQLRQKLKQYADYDEIKRELEIMKVYALLALSVLVHLSVFDSTLSSPGWKRRTRQRKVAHMPMAMIRTSACRTPMRTRRTLIMARVSKCC